VTYAALFWLLWTGHMALAAAGGAAYAINVGIGKLSELAFSANPVFEQGQDFADFQGFCELSQDRAEPAPGTVAPAGLVTVAPPVDRLTPDFVVPACPWLLIHGEADEVVPLEPVLDWCSKLATPPRIVLLPGVGHFFHGQLPALIEAVTSQFGGDFAGGPRAA